MRISDWSSDVCSSDLFRAHTMTRRTQFRLDKVTDRIHVLEGRMVVYLNVDEVIQTIRESDEPRAALMERFDLSERQAEDILEMRLRQLARLEGFQIDRKSVVQGKSVSVRVDLGGRRIIKNKISAIK